MDLSREFLGKKPVFEQSVLKQWSLQNSILNQIWVLFPAALLYIFQISNRFSYNSLTAEDADSIEWVVLSYQI